MFYINTNLHTFVLTQHRFSVLYELQMAMDGSFCLHTALDELLRRCQNLGNTSKFSSLLQKGSTVTEDEVVDSLAHVFLHPDYTIPIMGCFRAIAGKILDKVVSTLKLVQNLGSNSNQGIGSHVEGKIFWDCKDFDNVEQTGVIEAYAKAGRGLDLHELASLAFCRVLDMTLFLKGYVERYYEFSPSPFARVVELLSVFDVSSEAAKHLLQIVWTCYRLLLAEQDYFSSRWNWSCILELVQKFESLDSSGDGKLFKSELSSIRWCGMQILYVLLKLPSTAVSFGCSEDALACFLRWQEFCLDVSTEKAGWYPVPQNNNYTAGCGDFSIDTHTTVSSPNLLKDDDPMSSGSQATCDLSDCCPFVMTAAMKKSFERVVLALSQKWPVLLYGPTGCGKTAVIHKLARDSGNRVLSIHMDDQIDGRTLVGTYVCTEMPGEFRWQPGSLTQAVLNGLWIVFENIDQSPSDVQSILLPLLEGGRSFITSRGEEIRVPESFRLFATISTSKLDIVQRTEGWNSLSALWRRVIIEHPSRTDVVNVVTSLYPCLKHIVEKLIETFETVNQLCGVQTFDLPYRFTLRDLLKWCKRISGLGFSFGDGMSASTCHDIYLEAVDIFAAASPSPAIRLKLMECMSRMWAVPVSAVEGYSLCRPIFQKSHTGVQIGRVILQRPVVAFRHEPKPIAELRSSLHVLEKIACSVKWNEPVLLVGETGTGKTTLVQYLARSLGQKLTVLNLSQQSDVADLLGGFKPIDVQSICVPLYKEFVELFSCTFSSESNPRYLAHLEKQLKNKNWVKLFKGFQMGVKKVDESKRSSPGMKRKRPLKEPVLNAWEKFSSKYEVACKQITASSGMIFSFVEGTFVTALRNGEWILLDEVNLAPLETLQRIIGVLDGENGSLCLAERGDVDYLYRHPNFRIFACMNPATDAGKRDLPHSLRSRFTEYFVDDILDDEDLRLFVSKFDSFGSNQKLVTDIVSFYRAAKKESVERLQDGAQQKPQYSLRSLYRALEYVEIAAKGNIEFVKALYAGFCMFFVTLLDRRSAKLMESTIASCLLGGKIPSRLSLETSLEGRDRLRSDGSLENYLLLKSERECRASHLINSYGLENYVLTKTVKEHLINLAQAVLIGRYPVLLQGPTSSGKTSLVKYLAAITGHEFVRINNHEHTDLQEYLGSYITDSRGKLVFHEGVLVKAVRNGSWIVLDELNLAPSDVLEALNRLLDDNRELHVPELRETVRAHPDFMLFATQNPPTFYGGRKVLSRAFRNRFVEIHVDDIPNDELSEILERRCKIPQSTARKMVNVMEELHRLRQSSQVFAGKHGFITPRDLFRWSNRFRKYQDLAMDGYLLLAERLRNESEKIDVKKELEKHLCVTLGNVEPYKQGNAGVDSVSQALSKPPPDDGNIIWTDTMRRLYFLVERCYEMREPVLLVGETGGGKTTVCQILSSVLRKRLHTLNCHQYSETSDFIGGFYPVRERSSINLEFNSLIERILSSKAVSCFQGNARISHEISQALSTLEGLVEVIDSYRCLGKHSEVTEDDLRSLECMKMELAEVYQKWQMIFVWQDGPLVRAMKDGDLFLVDEISLADDSVLERLNSVLEPERTLTLAEKGGSTLEKIVADPHFFLLATMNPSGDYGKKELSPALRNRFTEIWVPPVSDMNELRSIALKRLSSPELHWLVNPLLKFWEWFNQLQTGRLLTVRDLLSWVDFVNSTWRSLSSESAFVHGLFLVLLDGLSLGTGISKVEATILREKCHLFLVDRMKEAAPTLLPEQLSVIGSYGWGDMREGTVCSTSKENQCNDTFGIHPFFIEKGHDPCETRGFEFLAPTTCRNVFRVLRAMQLKKSVLLEGSPGVGKTSLIVALGKFSGHKVVRINLSEQTDMMDLLGSDLPIECNEGMQFAWSDGILLQALKEGSWVLLDELNLAPQSVLEGLNAILDHRAEVFIPELGLSFKCPPSFRVFACQNPTHQGGGRKGLPKSFLNRFTKVYVEELAEGDYSVICRSLFPGIPGSLLEKLILFNKRLHEETMLYQTFAQDGSPWEFNLRDVIRSCEIIQAASCHSKYDCFLDVVYVQRMRTASDRLEVLQLYEDVFGAKPFINPYPRVHLNEQFLKVGSTCVKRNNSEETKPLWHDLKILPGIRNMLQAAAVCVQHQWPCIIVGPASSGKTSLIRLLAQLTGNKLNEINLSSATDTSELLGSFEQYDAYRNFCAVIAQVECYVKDYCRQLLKSSADAFLRERKDLMIGWLTFLSTANSSHRSSSGSIDIGKVKASLSLLAQVIELLKVDFKRNMVSVSWSCDDLDKTLRRIQMLQDMQFGRAISAKFEWTAGVLIKAIENGEWIILEDANLCNPTVLDRINSLAESNGSITVNECGNVDGKPLVLYPDSNFRMFLTVNPRYGNVSRAMRNRGVELVMMQPYWLFDWKSGCTSQEIEFKDAKRFLALCDIPNEQLVNSMAKAHVCAKNEGLCRNIQISYLELSRWVKLFQQLLMNGNQPFWSLQKSWEHTYVSALGEAEGFDIVNQLKDTYLSLANFSSSSWYLSLPCGWPHSVKLRDFIWCSKIACVRQSCMYLESLGSQCASYQYGASRDPLLKLQTSSAGFKGIYLTSFKMLQTNVLSKGWNSSIIDHCGREFDFALANKMLFFAAEWTVEQATKSDIDLYLQWFSWFDTQLQPYCRFFGSFLNLFTEELKHPIWKRIFGFWHEVELRGDVDMKLQLLPILSLESFDVVASEGVSFVSSKFLEHAIACVRLLRRSLWQWEAERKHEHNDRTAPYISVLSCLGALERKVLDLIVDSPAFEILLQAYSDLLEEHASLWNCISTSQLEYLHARLRSIRKKATKLEGFCPELVKILLDRVNMNSTLNSPKSLLWLHAGHPFLPCSADLYFKLQQLFCFSELVWPIRRKLPHFDDGHFVDIAASADPELRLLAMQGIFFSLLILQEDSRDESSVVEQLNDIHQSLLKRYETEKQKLELSATYGGNASSVEKLESCCILSTGMICTRSGFESFLEAVPVADQKSIFLDLILLQGLSRTVLADANELKSVISGLSSNLRFSMDFSLNCTSRQPLDSVAHQQILWWLDSQSSLPSEDQKIATSILEMWFRWHSFLWSCPSLFDKDPLTADSCDSRLPAMLVMPVKTDAVQRLLQTTFAVKDYPMYYLKRRVVSNNIWQSIPDIEFHSSLLQAARSLLQQIIVAHKKSFSVENYNAIKSIFISFEESMVQDHIDALISLLKLSSHQFFTSLIKPFIKPLLKDVYISCLYDESAYHIGCAWLRLGGLRLHLLLGCIDVDPSVKYVSKYLQLEERIKSLEIEIKVKDECNYLSGSWSVRVPEKQGLRSLDKLRAEREERKRKIIFRPCPSKFNELKAECNEFLVSSSLLLPERCKEFLEQVSSSLLLLKNGKCIELLQFIDEATNWQAKADAFIDRLSAEYVGLTDIIQPIQVAVYEVKLGLALVISSVMQKSFLHKMQEHSILPILDAIYSFMRFPHARALETSIKINHSVPEDPFYTVSLPVTGWVESMSFLEKIITFVDDVGHGKEASVLPLKASLNQNLLVRVTDDIAYAGLLDASSFMMLDSIFDHFVGTWLNVKVEEKTKKDHDTREFKFKPRAFDIEDICDIDLSSLSNSFVNDSFFEWKESLHDEKSSDSKEDAEVTVLEEWNLIQDSLLGNVVHYFFQFFGSTNLVKNPGILQVPDADRLHSFFESYTLGAKMIKELKGISSSYLDNRLLAEHLLCLCMEHSKKSIKSDKISRAYNFYKDSNATVIASMVTLLDSLKDRVLFLLNEWDEHPALQKILDVTHMLLSLPASTPLAKALSGMQFLLSRVNKLEDEGFKLPIHGELEPIHAMVSSWQQMEFNAWHTMLDDVVIHFEINAAKLWFPLHSILHRRSAEDISCYNQSTIKSLEDFIQTSSVGEFRMRLQLILAFYGQLNIGICLGSYTSVFHMESRNILYNVFGFYLQSLPRIMEHIENNRKNVEKELREFLRICKVQHAEKLLSMEISRRNRQKLKKLVQKYTDVLQQPVMLILNQEVTKDGPEAPNFAAVDLPQFSVVERGMWFGNWQKQVDNALHNLHRGRKDNPMTSVNASGNPIKKWPTSKMSLVAYQEEWNEVWHILEKLFRVAVDSANIWKDKQMAQAKRRAFTHLLEILENSGLYRHKSKVMKDQVEDVTPFWWFFLPSYDVQHLMPRHGPSRQEIATATTSSMLSSSQSEKVEKEMDAANAYYFKSMASVQRLQQICINPHNDFKKDADQIGRANTFIQHLLVIQQEQRAAAYGFTVHLKWLRECLSSMNCIHDVPSTYEGSGGIFLAPNQDLVLRCMWQQKELFDTLCILAHEEVLLLRTVENTHLSSCPSIKPAASRIIGLIDKFAPRFHESKVVLDDILLGQKGATVTLASSAPPILISRAMEQMVIQNFHTLSEFEEHLPVSYGKEVNRTVEDSLLNQFRYIIEKGKGMKEEFNPSVDQKAHAIILSEGSNAYNGCISEYGARCSESLNCLLSHITHALGKLGSRSDRDVLSGASLENITSWKILFDSYISDLALDVVCKEAVKLMFYLRKVASIPGQALHIGQELKGLHLSLDLLIAFCDGLLFDFLSVHKMIAIMTNTLAEIFVELFSKGYGVPTEEQDNALSGAMTQDASGTGMGEGVGAHDVSDQITDEDQLLGTSEKTGEKDSSNEMPGKNDKGIEMGDDFEADTFSISEDSADEGDNDGDEDEQLDSAMGKTGDNSDIVDEKLSNNEDENLQSNSEKHECGPSVKNEEDGNLELRAKEDSTAADDEMGRGNPDIMDQDDNVDSSKDDLDNMESIEEMNIDERDAPADPKESKRKEPDQFPEEDAKMDNELHEDSEIQAEHDEQLGTEYTVDENMNPSGETFEETECSQVDEKSDKDDDLGKDDEANAMMDLTGPRRELLGQDSSDFMNNQPPSAEAAPQMPNSSQGVRPENTASEMKWSIGSDMHQDHAPSEDAVNAENVLDNSSKGEKLSDQEPKAQTSQEDQSSFQKNQPNPFRNVGDALEEWKKRVMVSVDLQDHKKDTVDDMLDEGAEEYGFTSELEKGTAQALGAAMPDQVEHDVNGDNPDGDGLGSQEDSHMEIEFQGTDEERKPITNITPSRHKVGEEKLDINEDLTEVVPEDHHNDDPAPERPMMESLVSVEKSYMTRGLHQLSKLSLSEHDLRYVNSLPEASGGLNNDANDQWRRCELHTTRLSHELAEHLRLIMEPTLASRLQGDYRTGKRINMKKVIPYIASHYRKDRIWLRRTRPNKRDYQVVLVVDDSLSMSEGRCGDAAVEALVTVCRAMSLLEVGKFAVASYGGKQNIRLLHDFDQPFTGEAGMKMISSLTFKQDHMFGDEPMVDLLTNLKNMLDQAMANARLSSGHNPLEQLVLIIADGQFNDKPKVKRFVSDMLQKKRMVAFVIIDSPKHSIIDQQVVTESRGGKFVMGKYLDDFPFPYYIVLRNTEALPRTLADLLRQWFELMQSTRD